MHDRDLHVSRPLLSLCSLSTSMTSGIKRNIREGRGQDLPSHSYDVGPAAVYGGQYKSSPLRAWPGGKFTNSNHIQRFT